jgi:hypothetical protein
VATLCVVRVIYLHVVYSRVFERIAAYCNEFASSIPVAFVLGFFTEYMVTRCWDQYITIPYPDNLALLVSAFVRGADQRARLCRRTIVRYANLSIVMVFTAISPRAKKRFPTIDHLREAGKYYNSIMIIINVAVVQQARQEN